MLTPDNFIVAVRESFTLQQLNSHADDVYVSVKPFMDNMLECNINLIDHFNHFEITMFYTMKDQDRKSRTCQIEELTSKVRINTILNLWRTDI